MILNKLLFFLTLLLLFSFNLIAQDPAFSQFYANKLQANPAFAGTANCPRLILSYRNEWPSLSNSFITYSASYDQEVDVLSGGLGLQLIHDKTGSEVWSNLYASGIYSYTLKLSNKLSLKSALSVGFIQKSINTSQLNYGDMIDPRRGFVYETNDYIADDAYRNIDLSTGVLLYADQFHLGFAAYHLTEPSEGIINETEHLKRRYSVSASYTPRRKIRPTKVSWTPSIVYMQQGNFSQFQVGNYFNVNGLVLGLWSRLDDSFILLLGFHAENFKVGYSYDLTTSSLQNRNSGGSHELSFSYLIPCKKKKTPRFKTIMCPSF